MALRELISVVQPAGYSASPCGYCDDRPGVRSTGKTSKHYGLFAHQLAPRIYQKMLDAAACKVSRSQRHLLNRLDRFLSTGVVSVRADSVEEAIAAKQKGKGRASAPFDLQAAFRSMEGGSAGRAHKLEFRTEPAGFTQAKYELYKRYQESVHQDEKATENGFRRFLCDSPLTTQESGRVQQYGSFHQLYHLDGVLVAVGVIDILPCCISSVYFIWHPDYAHLALGKVGALREIAFAQQLGETLPELQYYYMGYYIHGCQKMRYKADFGPSYLLDPVSNTFHPFEHCQSALALHRRPLFAESSIARHGAAMPTPLENGPTVDAVIHTDDESEEEAGDVAYPDPPPLDWLSPSSLPPILLRTAQVFESGTIKPLLRAISFRDAEGRREASECLAALGEELGTEVVLYLK